MKKKTYRKFFLTVIILATTGVAVYFYTSKSDVSSLSDATNAVQANSSTSAPQVYINKEYNFSFSVDSRLVQETTVGGIKTIMFGSDSLNILSATDLPMIENSFTIQKDEPVQISGNPARKIIAGSMKDGSPMNILLLVKQETLYYFQGSQIFIDSVIDNFTFNNN